MVKLKHLFDTSIKRISDDPDDGTISCGFLEKGVEEQELNFQHYGGFLVLSGSGEYISENGIRQQIVPGDFVQRRPNIKHTTIVHNEEPWIEFFVCFGSSLYRVLVNMRIISDEPIIHGLINPVIVKRCINLLHEFKTTSEAEKTCLMIKVQEFLVYINMQSQQVRNDRYEEDLIKIICITLNQNFDRKIDIHSLAMKHKISYENLRKLFKKAMGISIYQYRIICKIEEAIRMLRFSDESIKSIAYSLDYSDQYAFSNQFKKNVGISPNEYRHIYLTNQRSYEN